MELPHHCGSGECVPETLQEEYLKGAHGMPLHWQSRCSYIRIGDAFRVRVMGCGTVGDKVEIRGLEKLQENWKGWVIASATVLVHQDPVPGLVVAPDAHGTRTIL